MNREGNLPIKRIFDVALTVGTLWFWLPLVGIVALAVRWRMGAPVFFRQIRPGLDGAPFVMVKFRTMRDEIDSDGRRLTETERLNTFGRTLRLTSLDELPELWNVLKGDMSLVGPRPLLMDYLALYTAEQSRRHDVRPGITGWAQVNGRNGLGWDKRFEHDVWYVEHRTLRLDVRILATTVMRVARREGVSPDTQEIMPRFTGSEVGDQEAGA
jgi:sugar transferase EpsL